MAETHDAPRLDPAVLLYLEAAGYVVVPARCVSPQGLASALRPTHDQVAPPPARAWALQGPGVPARLVRATAAVFGTTRTALEGPSREAKLAMARRCGMYFAHDQLGYSSLQISGMFGGREPSTVRHAIRTVRAELADPETAPAVGAAVRRIWRHLCEAGARPVAGRRDAA